MFEIIIGLITGALVVVIFRIVRKLNSQDYDEFGRSVKLSERVEKLEQQTRYVADQPERYYTSAFGIYSSDEMDRKLHENDVPIADVVKAIVKHLDMQIMKVPETTTKTPQEVKVVEKPQVVMSSVGIVTMPDGSGIPMPGSKPKRKYTKRKTK